MATHKPTNQTPEQIAAMAKTFTESAAELQAVAAVMKDLGFGEGLPVTNFDQISRAVEYMQNYVHAVKTAVLRARIARGDFNNGVPPEPKKKPAK